MKAFRNERLQAEFEANLHANVLHEQLALRRLKRNLRRNVRATVKALAAFANLFGRTELVRETAPGRREAFAPEVEYVIHLR